MDESFSLKPNLTIPQAVNRLGKKRSFIYKRIQSGEIDSLKLGRSRVVPLSAIEAYEARERTREATTRPAGLRREQTAKAA